MHPLDEPRCWNLIVSGSVRCARFWDDCLREARGVLRQAQSIGSKQEGLARDSFHVDHDSMQHYPARSKGEYFGPWSLTDRSRFAACAWGDAPVRILNFRRELFHHILTPILFRTIASTPAFNRAVKNHRSLFIFYFSRARYALALARRRSSTDASAPLLLLSISACTGLSSPVRLFGNFLLVLLTLLLCSYPSSPSSPFSAYFASAPFHL